ncbi:MAG: RluA family pseudouridine synthase [Bacteroidia bacterium]
MLPSILFEDYYLAVLHKPAGLMVEDDNYGNPSLQSWFLNHLQTKFPTNKNYYISFPHRIDRVTEGLIIIAKTKSALQNLNQQFNSRSITKVYHVLAEHALPTAEGTLTDYHQKHTKLKKAILSNRKKEGFVRAELKYKEVCNTRSNAVLYKVELITGRYHQIRVQFSSRNATVVGDSFYGATTEYQQGAIALIATEILFSHPKTNQAMHYKIPLPKNSKWQCR